MSRKALLAIPLLAAGLTGAHAESSRVYEFTGFDRIEAQAGLRVAVQYSEKHHIEVIAKNSDLFDKIMITQSGGSLVVKRKDDWSIIGLLSWDDNWTNDVQVNITTPLLTEVEASSGASMEIGPFDLDRLSLEATSGADLNANDITVKSLSLDASSGASLDATGACERLKAEASSGADINAQGVECAQGEIDVSSGADISAHLSTSVKADASSGGSINITGSPKNVDIEQTFGGSINIKR